MVQLSVYAKYLINQSGVRAVLAQVRGNVPDRGSARMIQLTDEQWAQQHRFFGTKADIPEAKPDFLEIFDSDNPADSLIF